MANTDSINTNI